MHPFIDRLRMEREVIALLNVELGRHLVSVEGLGRESIEKAANALRKSRIEPGAREDLIRTITYVSNTIRSYSSASHRGAMVAPAPIEEVHMSSMQMLRHRLTLIAVRK